MMNSEGKNRITNFLYINFLKFRAYENYKTTCFGRTAADGQQCC